MAGDELQHQINVAVGNLDRWLDTMRGQRGYTGPPADWWQHGFTAMGAMLDWRYEGIIAGYLLLWRRTGNGHWLAKAQWAGDDLLAGQSPTGYFVHGAALRGATSRSEAHAAACAAALLELALALREARSSVWQPYAAAAELAIHGPILGTLWDATRHLFRESSRTMLFAPHRAASICDVLFCQAELKHVAATVEEYALPTLRAIVTQQIRQPGNPLDGAIPFRVAGDRRSNQFLPLCIARVVPSLLKGYDWTGDATLLEAAWRAFAFVQRCRNPDGSLPAVVYPRGRANQYPHWIAAAGEVLYAAMALRERGISTDVDATRAWLLAGQDCTGGIATARGYGARVQQQLKSLPDVRDRLHVVGWCDKAFRGLAAEATDVLPRQLQQDSEVRCLFRGRIYTLTQSEDRVEIHRGREIRYRWRKGDDWPTICAPEFLLP
jgi:hypothetical protein